MRVQIWGSRGSIPTPGPSTVRYGGNTACVSVQSDAGSLLVLDAGSGIRCLGSELLRRVGKQSLSVAIFISHLHWDHILGLPFFGPLYCPQHHLSFFALQYEDTSLQERLEAQMDNPYFPVEMRRLGGTREFYEIAEQQIQVADCRITMRQVNHPQRCMSFRIESGGVVLTYATDHEPDGGPFDENLVQQAKGADLLILDAQYTRSEYENSHRGWGHGTWEQAVELARRSRARRLVLFHHDPDRDDDSLDEIVDLARKRFPATVAAAEGMTFHLSRRHEGKSAVLNRQVAAVPIRPVAVMASGQMKG